jgi:hypothetical protein
MEVTTFKDADNEKELSTIKETRDENEVILRARLSVKYEEKEVCMYVCMCIYIYIYIYL